MIWSLLASLLFLQLALSDFSCRKAPDSDMEQVCEMIQEWDKDARKEIRRRQAFGNGISSSASSYQDCKNLQCFCQMTGNRPGCGSRAYRREYRTLSDSERQRFHSAIQQLKASGEYDRLSNMHREVGSASGAHSGPGFLPWHREFMKRIEFSLRSIDPSISLPYWDSVLDSYLPEPKDSILWTPMFLGEASHSTGHVDNGPFAGFPTLEGKSAITRHRGREGRMFTETNLNSVFSENQIHNVMAYTAPQTGCPYPTNFHALEYTHSAVHLWVGGDMKPPSTSANDPTFYLHHSFVDFIWEQWRLQHQNRAQRESAYSPDDGRCANSQHFSNAQMRPWSLINREGLSNYYTDLLYSYAPRPSCSYSNPSCGSPYLFCDTRGSAHCVTKIRMSGRCDGFEGFDACYGGVCSGGYCQPGQQTTTPAPIQTTLAPTTRTTTQQRQRSRGSSSRTSSATKSVTGSSQCFNDDPCCEPWVVTGQCQSNVAYMSRYCRRSCGYCTNPTDSQRGCVDRHASCAVWRSQNFCASRRIWMSENCQRSCGWCGISKQRLCQATAGRRR